MARKAIDDALTGTTGGRRAATRTPPAAPTTTPGDTGRPTTTTGDTVPNPFAGVIEACHTAAQGYSPDNALRVIEWYEAMPELIDAIAAMLKAQGGKTVEEFFLYPAAGEFAQSLGDQFNFYREPCEAARLAFERAHADDLKRIRDPQRNQEKWDISASRD